jgi:hypothetical protein
MGQKQPVIRLIERTRQATMLTGSREGCPYGVGPVQIPQDLSILPDYTFSIKQSDKHSYQRAVASE